MCSDAYFNIYGQILIEITDYVALVLSGAMDQCRWRYSCWYAHCRLNSICDDGDLYRGTYCLLYGELFVFPLYSVSQDTASLKVGRHDFFCDCLEYTIDIAYLSYKHVTYRVCARDAGATPKYHTFNTR